MSELYKKDTYLNKDNPFLFSVEIYEYDIHAAGLSITKEYKLLDEKTIAKVEAKAKNKKDVAVQLGLIQKKDSKYRDELAEGFVQARKDFFLANQIESNEVISIKKDAIFTTHPCDVTTFGEIDFRLKHTYTSYLYTGKLELYYNIHDLDVKGIDDVQLYFHKDGLIPFLKKFFYKMEYADRDETAKFLRVYLNRYRKRELSVDFYRSFDSNSNYFSMDRTYIYNEITPELLPQIDISYNYFNVLIPLIRCIT